MYCHNTVWILAPMYSTNCPLMNIQKKCPLDKISQTYFLQTISLKFEATIQRSVVIVLSTKIMSIQLLEL